ncbi:hypothetical protein ASG52_02040 [Methylobacterium sp. Leaf456]|uniref:phage tail protein n=1 Tax=Methylobacterium sp. Leaf456 TaxID=1736382 RepID=UPI0006FDD578|nr:tail fiber protein [Methylobacterium sp. Leaf456]KQT61677.1 hypothetical protein ASG52_02040 [Methylobacterium sp. Leaf456]
MDECYLGEIRLVAFSWLPRNFAYCNGQLLSINSNTALYSLIGTTYGGDGRTTFALPNLLGRVVIDQGAGPGLSPYQMGQAGGAEAVTLQSTQIPPHFHPYTMQVDNSQGQSIDPTNGNIAQVFNQAGNVEYQSFTTGNMNNPANLNPQNTGANAGGGLPHANIQPYLVLSYIICVAGIYPSRA